MHRLTARIALAIVTVFAAAGCAGTGDSGPSSQRDPVRLSQDDYNFLQSVNTSQSDLKDALQLSFNKSFSPNDVSQKAQALAKILSASCALDAWTEPSWNYAADWTATQGLKNGAGTCPLSYARDWIYVKSTSSLGAHSSFHYATDEMRALGAVSDRNSTYAVATKATKSGLMITGTGDMTLKLAGGPDVKVHLVIGHLVANTRTVSTVSAQITVVGRFSRIVRVEQNSISGPRSYFVDAQSLDAKEFQSLFSALELDEIMDNTRVLR